jgi:hypothetical protein
VRFDTGAVERPTSQQACIATYETRVEDGVVVIAL